MIMTKIKHGNTIIPYGAHPEEHERETAKFFNKLGKDVEFLTPSYTKGVASPDIKMGGIVWEIKAPKGNSSRTIENNLRTALKQSESIIIDLRRIKLDEHKAISQIKKLFGISKKIKRILIISKEQILLDIKR